MNWFTPWKTSTGSRRLLRITPYFGVTIDFAHYASHGIGLPDLGALRLPLYDVHLSRIVDGLMHCALTDEDGTPNIDDVCRLLVDFGYDGTVVLAVRDRIWESAERLENALKALENERISAKHIFL